MKNVFADILNKFRIRFFHTIDHYYDMKICNRDLSKNIPSLYRDDINGVGMTGTQSTHYSILKKIFANVKIQEEDSLIDVGCGMGRILAFCIKEGYACSLNGIEINKEPGNIALSWSEKYNQINIMIGDAFLLDYNQYTVLNLDRPFLPKTFEKFIQLIESQLIHSIIFIYWVDQQSGGYLVNRKGWMMKKREAINRIYGIKIPGAPQWYSIWEYTPTKNNTVCEDI